MGWVGLNIVRNQDKGQSIELECKKLDLLRKRFIPWFVVKLSEDQSSIEFEKESLTVSNMGRFKQLQEVEDFFSFVTCFGVEDHCIKILKSVLREKNKFSKN